MLRFFRKNLRFELLAKIEVIVSVISFVIFYFVLSWGLTIESVIVYQLSSALLMFLLVKRTGNDWNFKLTTIDINSNIKIYTYGMYQTLEQIVNYFGAQFDQLLLGKIFGVQVLGTYSYLKDLVLKPCLQFFNPIVNRVSFPIMCKYRQSYGLEKIILWCFLFCRFNFSAYLCSFFMFMLIMC
ncbi:hypothetical protein TUM17384_14530 [Shewanella algae]|uniref:oligosaccharide flippase family protein n=1 Tax=Shewanella algae TaxID=38313 RepID=UPI001BEF84DC|nr:hypothetical protein TUM17384_14530 [Shewanella algae]